MIVILWFVDTNLLVYARDKSNPVKQHTGMAYRFMAIKTRTCEYPSTQLMKNEK
jgi:predicted nucleic acid-binding protein